ncbi:MAG: CRTAC1 family protein [Candidatus Brocadiae bacterium]|nr:CRTAC1 family protein [Candidatus Brocadiia bacterium]
MRRALAALLVAAAAATAGPAEEAEALIGAGKIEEAAALLETWTAETPDAGGLTTLLECRGKLRQWDAMADVLVRLRAVPVEFETDARVSRRVLEALGLCNWYATPLERVAMFGRLAKDHPGSPWRFGWLCVVMTNQVRLKDIPAAEAVEKELAAAPMDMAMRYRMGRAYVEAGWKPEQARGLLAEAVTAREAATPPEDALEREMYVTETSVWRAYLACAAYDAGVRREGNPFWEAEPEVPGFTDVTEAAGLAGSDGQRVAVGDLDGDGWDDLSFAGAVWINRSGTFVKRVEGAPPRGAGSLWGDADNDGDVDLWVFTKDHGVRLFLNAKGELTEAEGTGLTGALEAGPEGAGLGDANGDGVLDVYLAVYEGGDMGGGRRDRLFLSTGKGTWADALEAAGMQEESAAPRCGRGVNWGDFDNDGDADIFVSNYRLEPNYLWRNDGRGAFSNAGKVLGVEGVGTVSGDRTWYGHTIGSCWADLDNDLDLDLVSANLAHPRFIAFSNRTQILMNQGAAAGWTFTDIFPWSGVPFEETHSDVSACDWDADGDLDLSFTSVYRERPSWLLQNDGAAHFRPVTWRAGVVQFNGWGHAWLDHDNDGDMDLVVCAGNRPRLFRNDLPPGRGWLQVRLKGRRGNATGIGARVTVRLGGLQQMREVAGGRGTTSQDTARAHFGFGGRTGTAAVVVRWPGGREQRLADVAINRVLDVEEPE